MGGGCNRGAWAPLQESVPDLLFPHDASIAVMVCNVELTDADGYHVDIRVPWHGVTVTVPSQCGGSIDSHAEERHAKWCSRNHVMASVIAKARELWRQGGGPKCIKVTTMDELRALTEAFKVGLEAMGPQLWSAAFGSVSRKTPDALKSCCFIAVVVLRVTVGTTNTMPLRVVKMYAAGELHILLPASNIGETTRLKMGLAYKESVPERLHVLENESNATKKEMKELRDTQREMMERVVELEAAIQKLAGSPRLKSRRERHVTIVGTPVAAATPVVGTPAAAVEPRSPVWSLVGRFKAALATPSGFAARLENQFQHIETEVAPIQSLLSRIKPLVTVVVALLLSMYAPDAKAWLVSLLATAHNVSSLEPSDASLEPSDSA